MDEAGRSGGPVGGGLALEALAREELASQAGMGPTRDALASQAICRLFQTLAGGTGGPSALAEALGKSKDAVRPPPAPPREADLVIERPHVSGDARRKFYAPSWERIGEIFAQDHALELQLYRDHLIGCELDEEMARGGDATLAISGAGRLVVVRERKLAHVSIEPERAAEAARAVDRTVWEFGHLFRVYLGARSFPTLREYLLSAYQEAVRYAHQLGAGSELARFMRFQADALAQVEALNTLLERALDEAGTPPAPTQGPVEPPRTVRDFQAVGQETTDGTYVLRSGAGAFIEPD
ncbi:MAG: hypothetical protein R3185_05210, partial [Candidatus Thermoplasmatota archaeon]|nr:hypothetical protein [Candidatus Thermoplasmatota archaeon]